MVNVNNFYGTSDNEMIENAMKHREQDGIILIPPRQSDREPERNYWLLDRAILIPANTTVILQNCTIKLSDRCRDNFFRSANCDFGIDNPERIQNIHIRGEGTCTLLGADHPRSVGDSTKTMARPCPYVEKDMLQYGYWLSDEKKASGKLDFWDMHDHSYGTDAGKEGESQYGDWRNIGILFANAEHFSIENISLVDYHAWGITIEGSAYGTIRNIHFDACMSKEIDGLRQNMENQDGIHIHSGSHHIMISDITGRTGDDVIALRASIPNNPSAYLLPGSSLCSFNAMTPDWTKRDLSVHDITIRNVIAYSQLCFVVRLLAGNSQIWNVVMDGIIDSAPEEAPHRQYSAGILVGRPDCEYENHLKGSIHHISMSNILCNTRKGIDVHGYLQDSVISNVCNRHPEGSAIAVWRPDGLENVITNNLCVTGDNPIFEYENIPGSPAA